MTPGVESCTSIVSSFVDTHISQIQCTLISHDNIKTLSNIMKIKKNKSSLKSYLLFSHFMVGNGQPLTMQYNVRLPPTGTVRFGDIPNGKN